MKLETFMIIKYIILVNLMMWFVYHFNDIRLLIISLLVLLFTMILDLVQVIINKKSDNKE